VALPVIINARTTAWPAPELTNNFIGAILKNKKD
jgi:hypothetical protein